MKSKLFGFGAIAMASALVLAACGGGTDGSKGSEESAAGGRLY